MQLDVQAGGAASGAAQPAARKRGAIDAALNAALDAVEAALGDDTLSEEDAKAVVGILSRGLHSPDAGVARRAAEALERHVLPNLSEADALEAAAGAVPGLAQLAASGDAGASAAALRAFYSLLETAVHTDSFEWLDAAAKCFAGVEGAVEAAVAAVMRPGAKHHDVHLLELLLRGECGQVVQRLAAAGAATRLLSLVGDDEARDCEYNRCAALDCLDTLLEKDPRVADQILAADASSFCPVVEAAALDYTRKGDFTYDQARAFTVLEKLTKSSPAAARRAAASSGLLARLLAEFAAEQHFGILVMLEAVVAGAGDEGREAVLAAAAAAMASAKDDEARERLRAWLKGPPLQMEAPVISALERAASVPASLRARVAELEAIPINTRAAITELAQAVRCKRRRQEGE